MEEHWSINILSWKQLSSPKVNFQSYFELDCFYDLFLYSSEFGMYWSTLSWSREATFFIPGFWCCHLYLLFVGVFFIFHLRSEPREERLSSLGKLNLGPKSYCRCSIYLSLRMDGTPMFFFGYVKRGLPQKKLSNSAPKSSYPWANFSKQLPCFLCAFPLNTLAAPIVLRTALDLIIIVPWGNVAKLSR